MFLKSIRLTLEYQNGHQLVHIIHAYVDHNYYLKLCYSSGNIRVALSLDHPKMLFCMRVTEKNNNWG